MLECHLTKFYAASLTHLNVNRIILNALRLKRSSTTFTQENAYVATNRDNEAHVDSIGI